MRDLKQQVSKIAHDLLNLEVNTIIKPNISGEKMRSPRHALIDIAKWYSEKLKQFNLRIDTDIIKGSYESFCLLRKKAKDGINILESKTDKVSLSAQEKADLLMLHRIKDMSDQIKEVFDGLKSRGFKDWDNRYSHEQIAKKNPPFPLTSYERVLIRKVWELGVEEIALQTVIQLDGDVITRVNPRYLTSDNQVVQEIHDQTVSVSLRYWKVLIDTLKDFFGSILKTFT